MEETMTQEELDLLFDEQRLEDSKQSKLNKLRTVKPFILDNSLRETSVAAIRGHTLKDKWTIMRLVKESGVHCFIAASFSALKRVDDQFVMDLKDKGVICSNCFAFAELRDRVIDGVPLRALPLGLAKLKAYGIQNAIIECDFVCRLTDWTRMTNDMYADFILERCAWVKSNLSLPMRPKPADSWVNIRDLVQAMREQPVRVLHVIERLGRANPSIRPAGLMFEEPTGGVTTYEMGPIVETVRMAMELSGWSSGHFLVHLHHNYGYAEGCAMECLAGGCDGVWAAMCNEGAATGHAGYLRTLVNLARHGNQKAPAQFNFARLKNSAIRLTRIVTGTDPDPRTEVYGARAMPLTEVPGCSDASWGGLMLPLQPPDAKVVFGEGKCLDEEDPLESWVPCCDENGHS